MPLSSEQFLLQLRSALNHLYDPYFLRKSPLIEFFGLGDTPDAPTALQRILNEAIEALEPQSGDANPAQSRRIYELIMYRYVQQFGQEEIAAQLGMSVRHLRREQNAAIFRLGAELWERYGVSGHVLHAVELGPEDAAIEDGKPPIVQTVPPVANDDLEWLRDMPLDEPSVLKEVLRAVLDLSHPLANRHRVTFSTFLPETLPMLAIPPLALRQILLGLIATTAPRCAGGRLELSGKASGNTVEILITAQPPDLSPAAEPADSSSVDIAMRIAHLFGGTLECQFSTSSTQARLTLLVFEQIDILVIDDNADFIQLVHRETTGTRFRITGTRDPREGVHMGETLLPGAILLDVMMPRMDGWEVLGRLRSHPRTAHIPIIICTILAQEDLALSLGARLFLRKPVTRETVLTALDQVVAPMAHRAQESR